MRPLSNQDLTALLEAQTPPCVSIYLPTERSYPASQQGPIRYRNLVDRIEESMRQKYPAPQVQAVLGKFRELEADNAFWTHRVDGLGVLGSPHVFQAFDLQRPVPERAIVADSFHIKPLVRIAQSADRFQVLCLQREAIRLYEGNRDGIDPIEPAGVPLTIEEALGPGETYLAPRGPNVPAGHAAAGDDAKLDTERFFRAVDRAVWEKVTRLSDLPLVIAALPEHHTVFRGVSHNPNLVKNGIEHGPGLMSEQELTCEAWKCVEPFYLERLAKFVDDYHVARARKLGTDNLDEAAKAACDGRIGMLLVEAERRIPGRLRTETGMLEGGSATQAGMDDALDDVAEQVLRTKGSVIVVPAQRMPTATGLAAIYRY
jgi:hypothetical protein